VTFLRVCGKRNLFISKSILVVYSMIYIYDRNNIVVWNIQIRIDKIYEVFS